jgi:small subunit ribosomal protein S5
MESMEYQPLEQQFDERVIEIARVAKVVKGGRRFQFRVTIVIGDNHGKIGIGIAKPMQYRMRCEKQPNARIKMSSRLF